MSSSFPKKNTRSRWARTSRWSRGRDEPDAAGADREAHPELRVREGPGEAREGDEAPPGHREPEAGQDHHQQEDTDLGGAAGPAHRVQGQAPESAGKGSPEAPDRGKGEQGAHEAV